MLKGNKCDQTAIIYSRRRTKTFLKVYRTDMNGELNIEVKKDGRIMEKNLEVTKKASNLKSLLY